MNSPSENPLSRSVLAKPSDFGEPGSDVGLWMVATKLEEHVIDIGKNLGFRIAPSTCLKTLSRLAVPFIGWATLVSYKDGFQSLSQLLDHSSKNENQDWDSARGMVFSLADVALSLWAPQASGARSLLAGLGLYYNVKTAFYESSGAWDFMKKAAVLAFYNLGQSSREMYKTGAQAALKNTRLACKSLSQGVKFLGQKRYAMAGGGMWSGLVENPTAMFSVGAGDSSYPGEVFRRTLERARAGYHQTLVAAIDRANRRNISAAFFNSDDTLFQLTNTSVGRNREHFGFLRERIFPHHSSDRKVLLIGAGLTRSETTKVRSSPQVDEVLEMMDGKGQLEVVDLSYEVLQTVDSQVKGRLPPANVKIRQMDIAIDKFGPEEVDHVVCTSVFGYLDLETESTFWREIALTKILHKIKVGGHLSITYYPQGSWAENLFKSNGYVRVREASQGSMGVELWKRESMGDDSIFRIIETNQELARSQA